MDGNNVITKNVLSQEYIEKLRKYIIDGNFNSREQIGEYLDNACKDLGISLEELNSVKNQMYKYYDESMQDLDKLNMDAINELEIPNAKGDKVKYIQYVDPNTGNAVVLDDSMNDKGSVQAEYEATQEKFASFNTGTGEQNAAAISDYYKERVKEEANFVDYYAIDVDSLSPEKQRLMRVISQVYEIDMKNLIADLDRNIFVDKNTNEVYYVNEKTDGLFEVRKATDKDSTVIYTEEPAQKSNFVSTAVGVAATAVAAAGVAEAMVDQAFIDKVSQLSKDDVEFLATSGASQLTPEQNNYIQQLNAQMNPQIEEDSLQKQDQLEKQKTLVKVMPQTPQLPPETHGFTSIVFLCMMTSIYGIMALLYLVVSSFIGK